MTPDPQDSPPAQRITPVAASREITPPIRKVAPPTGPSANRLAATASPYLLQHAANPVDWWPWGAEALAEARRLDKPIFLSVGYATCYWCHVMERQVFENPGLAAAMNDAFVCVKVDREQHPGLDDIYMTATQLMTGSGGWPMNLALTPPGAQGEQDPGLAPFWAGTYVPPEPAHGRPGMGQLVHALSDAWRNRRQEVLEQSERVADAMRQTAGEVHASENPSSQENQPGVDTAWVAPAVHRAVGAAVRLTDRRYGGFGGSPKFPQPAMVAFLYDAARQQDEQDSRALRRAVDHTLTAMARGGMFDQLAGGFHRYSVDERWLVPHFEKMLYDQGQLLSLYAQASHAAPPNHPDRPLWDRTLRLTVGYLQREMVDDTGALFSAQDAEVDGHEGGNYLWTPQEVRDALADTPEGIDLIDPALELFGLDRGPNFTDPHVPGAEPKNVLFLAMTDAQWAARLRLANDPARAEAKRSQLIDALLAVRTERKPPITDDKALAAWNGMAIVGLVDAARACAEPAWIDLAQRAVDAVLEHLVQDTGRVLRAMRQGVASDLPGALEDHAHVVRALCALHRVGRGDGRYARAAAQIAERVQADFADNRSDPATARLYDAASSQDDDATAATLPVRPRSLHDGACPSGTAAMAWAYHDLFGATAEPRWKQALTQTVSAVADEAKQASLAFAHGLHAAAALAALDGPMVRLSCAPADPAESPSDVPQNTGRRWNLRIDIRADLYLTGLRVELDGEAQALPPEQPVTPETRGHRGTLSIAIDHPQGDPPTRVRITASPCSMAACFAPVSAEIELTNEPTRASAATPPGATLPGGHA
ncbi:MAG: thioredoxin domain-containing protein [Planctomycetota bacterium]